MIHPFKPILCPLCVCYKTYKRTLRDITRIIQKQQRTSRLASSYIASVLKTPAGGDAHLSLSRVIRRCCPLFFGTAIQIANFIQMKGTDAFRVLSRAVCVRSFRYLLFVQDAAKGALFAFVRCYCLRVGALVCACTLFEAVYLPFALLLLLLKYFVHLARFCAFMWLVLQPRLLQPLLCSLRSENQRAEGQRWRNSRGTSPPPPWVRFIVCGVRPRLAAVFRRQGNYARRRGQ